MDRWECRPIEMLSFYQERRLEPPDDIMAAARVRTLNLPLVHAVSVLVRYQIVTFVDCLYMGTIGGLPLKENIRLMIYAVVGMAVFPIFSFFLSERLLYPVRQFLAEKTRNVRIDDSRVIQINTRTRVLSILLATVIAPLLALGALVYQRLGTELGAHWVLPIAADHVAAVQRDLRCHHRDLMLAAGIGILLATSISNPLGHIVKVIRELEKGNLQGRANLIANDEIGVLSQSFDKMALSLKRTEATWRT